MEETVLVNRVDQSGLVTFDLEKYYPEQDITEFDIKPFLFHELILKEKDFREALKNHDWNVYKGHTLCIYCSNDAIIPVWAYMLIATKADGIVKNIFTGTKEEYLKNQYQTTIQNLDISSYKDKRIVIKGCSNKPVPASAYADITARLMPFALSIMYGEPCSTVPVYKRMVKG